MRRLLSSIRVLQFVWVAASTAASIAGHTIQVPKEQPTIQAAIDAATDGDTIIVAPGTYRERLTIKGKGVTLASQFLVSRNAADREQTILDGGKADHKQGGPIIVVDKSGGAITSIIGFTIRNSDHAVINSGRIEVLHNRFVENSDALSFESGGGIVRSNVFENNSDDGIDMDGASEATIEDNLIRNNKDDGIEIRLHKYRGSPLDIVIRRNVLSGNREDGLQLIDYPGKSDRTLRIERNLFVKNAMAAVGTMEDGDTKENYAGAELLEPVSIVNNTFADNHFGITGGDNMVVFNNIFVRTAKTTLKRIRGDSAAGVNLLWNNGLDMEDCDLNASMFLTIDPKFDRDYRLATGSPCIDAGAATFEYNGENLTLPIESYAGAAPDLGAFEVGR